jgi:endogenous inhibitor of DNA gyrase (YacG/DUF329 family)
MPSPKCPICGRAITAELQKTASMPFCSTRCRQVDLSRWLGEQYAVPTTPSEGEEDEPPADQPVFDDHPD